MAIQESNLVLGANDMQRVAVIGTSCSGKTTFARSLARKLSSVHIELDSFQWMENWTPRPLPEFLEMVSQATMSDRWVLDGNYSSVRDIVWARATTLIWLNFPFQVVAFRALRRTVSRVLSGEKLWAGNVESFRISFLSRDSILWWVATTYHRRRREYPTLFKLPPPISIRGSLNSPHRIRLKCFFVTQANVKMSAMEQKLHRARA